jgi:replicative DNA helicase
MDNPFKNFKLEDRLPPQNLEAEQCLLGSLMLDKKAVFKVIDFLSANDFYRDTHKIVFEAILFLFEKGEPIDLVTVSNRLKETKLLDKIGGMTYLTELVNSVPTAAHVLNYAEIVRKKRILRDLIEASYSIAQLGYSEDKDMDLLLDEAEKSVFAITQKTLNQRFIPIKDSLAEAFDRIDNLNKQKGVLRGLSTGFRYLDNILAGLQKSDLIILAARPSLGKSSLALDIARNVAVSQNQPVGIFSLEMSSDQIVDRFLSAQSGVDLWKIRTGNLSDDEINNDFARLQHSLGALSEAPIYIDDSAITNVLQMRAMARRLQGEKGLGLLVIDYLQLVDPRESRASPVQQMTEISRSLKGLARELNVPVLAVSQLSRAVEQRPTQIPRLSDLRESGSLEQDADVVMFIYREDRYKQDSLKRGMADIIIAKHRNGPVGKVELFFDEGRTTFRTIERGEGSMVSEGETTDFVEI